MYKEEPINKLRSEVSERLEKIESYQKSYAELSAKYTKLSEKYSPQVISVKYMQENIKRIFVLQYIVLG